MTPRPRPSVMKWMRENPAELREVCRLDFGVPSDEDETAVIAWMRRRPNALREAHRLQFGAAAPAPVAPVHASPPPVASQSKTLSAARRARFGLTNKQGECLDVIADYHAKHRRGPTYDEIAAALDLRSKSGVHRLVIGLEERGAIRRLPNRARTIALAEVAS